MQSLACITRSSTIQGKTNGEDGDDGAPVCIYLGGHSNRTNVAGAALERENFSGQSLSGDGGLRDDLPPELPLSTMHLNGDAGAAASGSGAAPVAVASDSSPYSNAAAIAVGVARDDGGHISGGFGSSVGGDIDATSASDGVDDDLVSAAGPSTTSRTSPASFLSRAAAYSPAGVLRRWTRRATAMVGAATTSATTPTGPSPPPEELVPRMGLPVPDATETDGGRQSSGSAGKTRLGAGWRTHVGAAPYRADFSCSCEDWGARGVRRTSRFAYGSPF